MRKIADFIRMLWQKDKWLFSIFCIGIVSVLIEIFMTFSLLYITLFVKGSLSTRNYDVSQSWAWAPVVTLGYIYFIGFIALLVTIFYIVSMKVRRRPIHWKYTIAIGTMTFWTYLLWLIFTLISNFLLSLALPHLFR